MRHPPKIGTTGTVQFRVEASHAIDFADQDMPAVLSTPWLIWFLEHAARQALLPILEPGESTVGVHVTVDHRAATPVGMDVTCQARVVHVDGTQVYFQLDARDEREPIARGFHRLRVIQIDRFATRVARKLGRD